MRVVLAELVPAVVQGGFTRKGRDWAMGRDGWDAAFAAVFRAADEGKLDLPLTGNAYLFEVAMRLADKAEAQQERGQEQALRSRAHTSSVPTGSPSPHIMIPAVIKVPIIGITKMGITERSTLCTGIFFR